MDREVTFEIQGDKLVRYTPMPDYGENTCKMDVLMDKETFIKCFREWISFEGEPSREGMTVLPVGNPVTEVTEVHI